MSTRKWPHVREVEKGKSGGPVHLSGFGLLTTATLCGCADDVATVTFPETAGPLTCWPCMHTAEAIRDRLGVRIKFQWER